ncbi:hypothetical protein BSZ14_17770 [Sphingomonas sp. Sph1(2015)]|nr:hypothetical protein BSZ14_17770 [Sphingomonas sp. Sph1(2015)]
MAVGLAAIQKGQSVPGYAAISKVTAQQRLLWKDMRSAVKARQMFYRQFLSCPPSVRSIHALSA